MGNSRESGGTGRNFSSPAGRDQAANPNFYFSNLKDDTDGFSSIRVSLDAAGSGNNPRGVGAVVTVKPTGSSIAQSRLVDAGTGRGTQGPASVFFGLGDATSGDVTIRWPDGYEQIFEDVSSGTHLTAEDDHYPGLVDSLVTSSYAPTEGPTSWKFIWYSDFATTYHLVEVWDTGGSDPDCKVVPKTQSPPLVLEPGVTTGVSMTTKLMADGSGRYKHVLIWNGVDCEASCAYTFKVHSWSADREDVSTLQTHQVSACGQIQG